MLKGSWDLATWEINKVIILLILNAARRPPRPGRMLGGRHDARSGALLSQDIGVQRLRGED